MRKEDNRLVGAYFLCIFFFAIGFAFYLRNRNLISDIENFAAKNCAVAWLLMLSLYVFRAFIPFLPSFAFYAMSGRIFPGKLVPFMVSLSGVTLLYALSYWIGWLKKRPTSFYKFRFGFRIMPWERVRKAVDRFCRKWERVMRNQDFVSLLIFSLSPLPQKLFGRVCGRTKNNFWIFLSASLLGTLPKLMSVTLIGKSILDMTSPLFYVSLLFTVSITVMVMILFHKSNKKEIQSSEKGN